MNLDDYAREKAFQYVKHHGDAFCVGPDGQPHPTCVDELAQLIEEAYTQGAADQKRGAVAALATISPVRTAGIFPSPVIRLKDAVRVVEASQPESAGEMEDHASDN